MTRWQNANHKDAPPSGHGSKANTDVTTLKNKQTKKKKHYRFLPTHQGNAGIHSSIPS